MVSPILTDNPEAGDVLSDSQVDLRNNFNYVQVALGRDHQVVYGTDANGDLQQGRHNQVSFITKGNATVAVPGGAGGLIYNSNQIGKPNLYWNGTGAASPVQLTNGNVTPSAATNGTSFLPSAAALGGIMIQWGRSTTTSTAFPAAPTVNFPTPFSDVPYSVVVSVLQNLDAGKVVQVVTTTANSFTVTTRDTGGGKVANVTYSWIAIGPK